LTNHSPTFNQQGQSPVGGDCYRTIYTTFKTEFQSLFMPTLINGALENSTLHNPTKKRVP